MQDERNINVLSQLIVHKESMITQFIAMRYTEVYSSTAVQKVLKHLYLLLLTDISMIAREIQPHLYELVKADRKLEDYVELYVYAKSLPHVAMFYRAETEKYPVTSEVVKKLLGGEKENVFVQEEKKKEKE